MSEREFVAFELIPNSPLATRRFAQACYFARAIASTVRGILMFDGIF
jgi:hypothetical protein